MQQTLHALNDWVKLVLVGPPIPLIEDVYAAQYCAFFPISLFLI